MHLDHKDTYHIVVRDMSRDPTLHLNKQAKSDSSHVTVDQPMQRLCFLVMTVWAMLMVETVNPFRAGHARKSGRF